MEENELALKRLEFEKSLDQRKFEIENFWKRGWFFVSYRASTYCYGLPLGIHLPEKQFT